MRIASFNVQNLFERAVALAAGGDDAVDEAILKQGQINVLLRKAVYTDDDRAQILTLLTELGLRESDDGSKLVMLRQNRGQLVRRRQNGTVEIPARGRESWVGWVEMKTAPVNELTTKNTARVINEVDADILGVVEAENRVSLRDFSRVMLRREDGDPYAHSMLIEGNDDRGINVGLMTKEGLEIVEERTHIFDLGENDSPIFSRDCVEYRIRTPGGGDVLVLVNHFKSKRGGGDERRLIQATRVKEIVNERLPEQPNLVVLGDLNDSPDADTLAPLLDQTPLEDISASPKFKDGGFAGTFGTMRPDDKFDYVLLAPSLMDKVTDGGVFRKGVFTASDRWPMLDGMTEKSHQASDHAAVWANIDLH